MRVKVDKLVDAYQRIKDAANADGSSVLICVAGDMDAISASHIFTTLLRADGISLSLHAVQGYEDVVKQVDNVDLDSCRCVVLLNCGANLKIYERLQLDSEDRKNLQVFVVDSHRPFLLDNIFADVVEGMDFNHVDLKQARIILMDYVNENQEEEYPVPSVEEVIGAELKDDGEEDEDDDEDEEEEYPTQSPSRQRRRVGEDGESVDGDEEESREEEKQKKARRKECRAVIDEYYRGSYFGQSSATLMFQLARELRKDNNAMLWWGVLGLTDQHVHDRVDTNYYNLAIQGYQEEALRLNPDALEEKRGGSKIAFYEEFRFLLMQHWTLYNSMYYSNYVASQLGIWKDRTTNKLQTLLAKMGIKLTEARQKFVHMKASLKDRLPDMLAEHAQAFDLEEVVFGTFRKERRSANPICATDCIHICSAMLYATPSGSQDWTDCFYKAYDATRWCAEREELWDEAVATPAGCSHSPAVQRAIDLHQVVVEKGFELAQDKGRIVVFPSFRFAHFALNDKNKILQQPAVLSRLALFLMQMDSKQQSGGTRREAKPIVVGVDDEETQTCTVVGVVGPNKEGYRERNSFGNSFRKAVAHFPNMEVQLDGFDTEVIQIPAHSFHDFVQCIFDNHQG